MTQIIQFSINYKTQFGESIKVIGSTDNLGNWDIERAISLNWSQGNFWTISIAVQKQENFQYKYILKRGNDTVWEEGRNRVVNLKYPIDILNLQDLWNHQQIKIIYNNDNLLEQLKIKIEIDDQDELTERMIYDQDDQNQDIFNITLNVELKVQKLQYQFENHEETKTINFDLDEYDQNLIVKKDNMQNLTYHLIDKNLMIGDIIKSKSDEQILIKHNIDTMIYLHQGELGSNQLKDSENIDVITWQYDPNNIQSSLKKINNILQKKKTVYMMCRDGLNILYEITKQFLTRYRNMNEIKIEQLFKKVKIAQIAY